MATPVDWYDDEHTIIKVTITHNTTWDEYHQVVDWIVTKCHTVDHRVDLIFCDDVGMPKGNPLPHIKAGAQKIINLPIPGHTFIAGSQGHTNSFTYLIMSAIARTYVGTYVPNNTQKQLLFVPNLEAALEYIRKDRAAFSAIE